MRSRQTIKRVYASLKEYKVPYEYDYAMEEDQGFFKCKLIYVHTLFYLGILNSLDNYRFLVLFFSSQKVRSVNETLNLEALNENFYFKKIYLIRTLNPNYWK